MKIFITEKQLAKLKDDFIEKDEFVIGGEGGNNDYFHVMNESRLYINWEDVDGIQFTTYADVDEMNDALSSGETTKEEWLKDNVSFDIDFYDSNYEFIGRADTITYGDLLEQYSYDNIPTEYLELVLKEFNRKPDFFDGDYRIDDVKYNLYSDCDDIDFAAKHLFVTADTYYCGMHGYIMKDGTMILMSPGSDHAEIESIKGVESKWHFVQLGYPSVYGNNLRVGGLLTWEQKQTIGRMARGYSNDELYVSFLGGPKGDQSCCYTNPHYQRVLGDIERYYDEGIIPLGENKEKKKIVENNQDELKLYHGGVNDFDKFDLSFAHSGEGFEAYGFGVYATTVEHTARYYSTVAQNNNDIRAKFGGYDASTPSEKIVLSYLRETNGDIVKALQNIWGLISLYKEDEDFENLEIANQAKEMLLKSYKKQDNGFLKFFKPHRIIYEVDIPDDNGENYIDWKNCDKRMLYKIADMCNLPYEYENFSEIYEDLAEELGSSKAASEKLHSLGFNGTKVITQLGDGINYTIFDSNDVKIMRKTNIDLDENIAYKLSKKQIKEELSMYY